MNFNFLKITGLILFLAIFIGGIFMGMIFLTFISSFFIAPLTDSLFKGFIVFTIFLPILLLFTDWFYDYWLNILVKMGYFIIEIFEKEA